VACSPIIAINGWSAIVMTFNLISRAVRDPIHDVRLLLKNSTPAPAHSGEIGDNTLFCRPLPELHEIPMTE